MPLTCDKPEASFLYGPGNGSHIIIIRYRRKTDGYKKKMSKGKILNSPANCVDTWIRTKDPHHVKVIL